LSVHASPFVPSPSSSSFSSIQYNNFNTSPNQLTLPPLPSSTYENNPYSRLLQEISMPRLIPSTSSLNSQLRFSQGLSTPPSGLSTSSMNPQLTITYPLETNSNENSAHCGGQGDDAISIVANNLSREGFLDSVNVGLGNGMMLDFPVQPNVCLEQMMRDAVEHSRF
jgi:hypothetical protein